LPFAVASFKPFILLAFYWIRPERRPKPSPAIYAYLARL
jgi:hypothetical protein